MKTLKLPKVAREKIKEYEELDLGGKKVRCTYFINTQKKRDLRSMVGKGTPEEITMEAQMWEKLKGVDFSKMSEEQIREFLEARGLGIDCSAFVVHVLNAWYKEKKGKNIWREFKSPYKSIKGRIGFMLRPVENLGVDYMTGNTNTTQLSINEVRPGDVIRSKWKKRNSHHIFLIEEVDLDENENVRKIRYVNSTEKYGRESGIRHGEIIIHDSKKDLSEQEWVDFDIHKVNFSWEGFMVNKEDNGPRRLNAMKELI